MSVCFGVRCSNCGYDMSGLADAEKCPECGTDDWRLPRWDSKVTERVHLVFAMAPLACLVLIHLVLLVARLELGRWPSRFGADDPANTPVVRMLAMPAMLSFFPALVAPFVSFTIVAALTGLALFKGASWQPVVRTAAVGFCILLPALLLLLWDPCGVRIWLAD